MNKNWSYLMILSLSFLFSIHLIAQSTFEGKVKFKITHEDEVNFLDYFIKGDNIRIEIGDNEQGVFLKNSEKTLILMPEEEMYMDLDQSVFKKLSNMTGMNNDQKNNEEQIDFEKYKTGKVMEILGYECHQWVFKEETEDDEVEAWVTDELGNFMMSQSPMGGGYSPGWSSSVQNNGFFPILVITRDDDGDETSRFEATEINETDLEDALFSPPSNYTEMKIPGMDSFLK